MEQHCAVLSWKRSVAKCSPRYTSVLSDGDGKSCNYIVEREVYGKDVSIINEGCTIHVSKGWAPH